MRFGLKENTIAQINTIFAKYPQVESVILYGSRAKGNYKPGSDIDLTLTGDEVDLSLIHTIELDLDDLLLPYTLELSAYRHLSNPDLLDHIDRVGKLFYRAASRRRMREAGQLDAELKAQLAKVGFEL